MRTTEVFRLEATAPAAARTFVRDALGDRACRPAAELVASELVANAVRHGAEAQAIEVVVHGEDGLVRIEVTQHGDPEVSATIDQAPSWLTAAELSGRGLRIVDALAMRWGVHDDGPTTVWCELAC